MKKMLLVGMFLISGLSFARDYTYNEMRDIVIPAQEQHERLSRETSHDWALDNEKANENFERYSQFHKDLDNMDRGRDRTDR